MHQIQIQIYKFLESLKDKPYKIPQILLSKFSTKSAENLKQYFEREPREFRLNMSNIGRPICQLKFEKLGIQGENQNNQLRLLYGNMAEDILIFLLHAAGIKILAEQKRVSVCIDGETINGVLDIVLDLGRGPEVWDIKSASDWSFKNKFNVPFKQFLEEDTFGYVSQVLGYSIAEQIRCGGILYINKSDGEIGVLEFPEEYQSSGERKRALGGFQRTIQEISKYAPQSTKERRTVYKQFNPEKEVFRGKPTGLFILPKQCTFCKFNRHCWKTLELKPQVSSNAKNPKLVYYVDPEKETDDV